MWDLLGLPSRGRVHCDLETCVDVVGVENENEPEGVRKREEREMGIVVWTMSKKED